MFRVQTLNQIAEKGLQVLGGERYEVGRESIIQMVFYFAVILYIKKNFQKI